MARNNSIGSLFIDIQARTAKLETDLGRVRHILEGTSKDVQQVTKNTEILGVNGEVKFLKMVTAAFGAQSAVRLLAREFRYVYDNIEQIKGIDPQVQASVMGFHRGVSELRREVDVLIAKGLGKFADFGTALGVTMANYANQKDGLRGVHDPKDGIPLDSLNTAALDQQQRDRDVNYDEKVLNLQVQIAEARNKVRIAGLSQAEQITELRELTERYNEVASKENRTTEEKLALQLKAFQFEQQANEKLASLKKQLADAEKTVSNSMERGAIATVSNREKIDILGMRIFNLRQEWGFLIKEQEEYKKGNLGKENVVVLERLLEVTKQLGVNQAQLNTALAKQGELFRDLGASMAANLESAIIKGGKLRDILKGIGMDILQIIVRQSITNPIADMIGGSGGLLATLFSGHAMGGPLDGPTMVGEKGPELLIPSNSGQTIIPNEQLRSGRGGGSHYVIDARGADRTGMDQLMALIRRLDGSIENRAIAAVNNRNRRGPAY